jgi:ubiquinone/menaquinone biosynthesis C-methylase UbiE
MSNTEPSKSLLKYVPQEGLILDAGCGYFTYTNLLRNYNDKIICMDIFNLNMDEARKNDFLLASVENLPFKDNSFDFIYCLSVVQLIKDDAGVINEFNRVLKKKGRLLFTVPTRKSIFRLLRDLEIACGVYKCPEFNVKHHHYYTRSDIQKFTNNKFKLIDLYGYEYNFVHRLLIFLISIFKLEPILRDIKNRFIKTKIKANDTADKNLNMETNIKSGNLFEFLQHRFKFINDISYHYIVVLERI